MDSQANVVGLMADPGLSRRTTRSVADDLHHDLSAGDTGPSPWEIDISDETLPLTPDGDIDLMDRAEDLRKRYGWDYVVYLTDLPRYQDQKPLVCEVSDTQGAALVSLTALGALGLRRKTRKLLVALLQSARRGLADTDLGESVRSTVGLASAQQLAPSARDDTIDIVLPGWWSQARLLSGMVRSNRPGSMLPAMSTCITAAVATGAFGIYYGSIWNLADALGPGRHALISVVVIAALSFWLIFRNRLWNRSGVDADPWHSELDNLTTVIMVTTSVLLMYLLVAAILFGVSLAVVDASYLESEIRRPVTLLDYGELSWLSASLGATAGALGSNFDSDEKVRAATFSKRQHERRQRADASGESG